MASSEHGHPALIDERTGLPNRLQFDTVYRFLFAGADRGVPLALLMVQMDVRDEEAFRRAADELAKSTRGSDLLAHLGDGRFVTLLLGCNVHGARLVADRVAGLLADVLGTGFAVGLAGYRDDMTDPSQLMDAVVGAMSDAQAAGGGMEIGVA